MYKLGILLVTISLIQITVQDAHPNDVENEIDHEDSFENVVQSFISSESGKHIGEALLNMGASKNANQLLEGIGAILGNGGAGNLLDPSVLSTAFNLLTTNTENIKENKRDSSILSWLIELFAKEGGVENFMKFLPLVVSSFSSFLDVEGNKASHAGHDWLLPPIIEKIHVLYSKVISSDSGRMIMGLLKEAKLFKTFANKEGEFSVEKFFELIENHSFRKQWIEVITSRIGEMAERVMDPHMRLPILMALEMNFNNALKERGFPKDAVFDMNNIVDSLSAIVNYGFKKWMGYQIRSKQYVKTVADYCTSTYEDWKAKGYLSGNKIDASNLSNNLANFINLELIEPFARVFRGYRFVKKHPKCDKYVMCMMNKPTPKESENPPKVKIFLTQASSLLASWLLSNNTGASFWTLYSNVIEDSNCKGVYVKACDGFHEEEHKVTTEYVHSEL